jgi:hypothetical protein
MSVRRLVAIALILVALPVAAGAQRAWLDPETGQLGVPPPEEAEAGPADGAGAAAAPLVIEPGRTEAGGVMVNLRGRPLYELKATLQPDGRVETDCVHRDQ